MTIEDVGVRAGEDEIRRVEALHALEILDTPPDERFDRLTRLAQQLFRVPMVSLTLVDSDRQWRKSMQGPLEREAPRHDSFCDATLVRNAPLVVPDAAADPVFEANPFVQGDPHLRFYAGHPLEAPTGEPIGTFCIMDTEPRALSDSETALLRDLSALVQAELVRDSELEQAAEVQRGLLPKAPPDLPGFEFGALCEPARRIGGDLYDWYPVPGGVAVSLADVMGKGLGAAILAATVRAVLRGTAPLTGPAAALAHAADALDDDLAEASAFVTVFHSLVADDGTVRYADAGHGLAAVVRQDGGMEPLRSPDPPMGVPSDGAFQEGNVHLEVGDALLCCSDGVSDALGSPWLTLEAGARILGEAPTVDEAIRRIRHEVPWGRVEDDVTVVIVRRIA
ncbi:PP2C family protein-serine/threonine phosphatase [Naasia sp. SYSU D00948]|uniref:PP2C family protein-serine/threonine phosphatase n=1 Tax=Naasia sp. SYSU D00948 TaxID=2817379 RepID=UPI001B3121A4|nr:GAF domain-containing SpoIIE family protein phosphatase [Naasia sp. SYSU D00948]